MLDIAPITGLFGAKVRGVDFARPVSDDTVRDLQKALDDHKVLVFPDAVAAEPLDLLDFASRFGVVDMEVNPNYPFVEGTPGVILLESDGEKLRTNQPQGVASDGKIKIDTWHTDGGSRANTSWVTFLKAVTVPAYGRDTVFADMEAVLSRLSKPLQAFLRSLTAVHAASSLYPDAAPVEHPVVMRDPASGREWLFVNRLSAKRICGLNPDESDHLLQFLFEQVHQPECQLRVSWTPGMLTMWNNQNTQHYIVFDQPFPRVMQRVMVTPGATSSH